MQQALVRFGKPKSISLFSQVQSETAREQVRLSLGLWQLEDGNKQTTQDVVRLPNHNKELVSIDLLVYWSDQLLNRRLHLVGSTLDSCRQCDLVDPIKLSDDDGQSKTYQILRKLLFISFFNWRIVTFNLKPTVHFTGIHQMTIFNGTVIRWTVHHFQIVLLCREKYTHSYFF